MRPGLGAIGYSAFLALLQHELGHGIAGKVVEDRAIGAPCCRKIASLELSRGKPRRFAQLFIPIANTKFWIVTGAKRAQFIDHELGLTALHLNPLDRPREYVLLCLIVDAVADADRGA